MEVLALVFRVIVSVFSLPVYGRNSHFWSGAARREPTCARTSRKGTVRSPCWENRGRLVHPGLLLSLVVVVLLALPVAEGIAAESSDGWQGRLLAQRPPPNIPPGQMPGGPPPGEVPPEHRPPEAGPEEGVGEGAEPKPLQWIEPQTKAGKQGQEFLRRMAEIAAARPEKSRKALAVQWATLRNWCLESGMEIDARMCELRASLLAGQDEEVANLLGRTEEFEGVPVTPEQAEFLRTARPLIDLRNRHMEFDGLSAGISGQKMQPIAPGGRLDLRSEAGKQILLLSMQEDSGEKEGPVALELRNGTRHRVELVSSELLPAVLIPPLKALRIALEAWNKYQDPEHPWPDEDLEQRRGWQKTDEGWDAPISNTRVRFFTSAPQQLTAVQISDVRLSKVGGRGPSVLLRRGAYRIVGRLEGFDWQRRPVVLISSGQRPAMVQPMRAQDWGRLWNGTWQAAGETIQYRVAKFRGRRGPIFAYRYSEEPVRAVRRIMDLQSRRYGRAGEQLRVQRRARELRRESLRREISGELLGSWQTDLWLYDQLGGTMHRQWRRGQFLAAARNPAAHVGTAGHYSPAPSGDAHYLDWHLVRAAVVPMASPFAAAQKDPGTALDLIPLMRAEAAVSTIRKARPELDVGQRGAALRRLRRSLTPETERYLRGIAEKDPEASVRRRALVTLGEMGTRSALEACRAPAIEPKIRATSRAALAGAGDPEGLEAIEEMRGASAEERSVFLEELLDMESPTVLLAISRAMRIYTDPSAAERFAEKLGRMQGRAGASLLAQLMQAHGRPFADACGEFAAPDMAPLVGPLAGMLSHPKEGIEVAAVLGLSGSEAATDALKEKAEEGQPMAIAGLAVSGNPDLLEDAGSGAEVIRPDHLEFVDAHWRRGADPETEGIWRSDLDREAALEFLRAVLERAEAPRARLEAARLLRSAGEDVDPEALLGIASMPLPQLPAAGAAGQQEEPGGPPAGMPPGEMPPDMPPPGRGRPGGPPDRAESAEKQEEPATGPQVEALRMLEEVGPRTVTNGLIELVETTKSIQIKKAALHALGQAATQKATRLLSRLAAAGGDFQNAGELVERARVRLAAVRGLAAAAHPAAVGHLHDLWFKTPGGLEQLRNQDQEAFEQAWAQRQRIVYPGLCRAILAIPVDRTLAQVAAQNRAAREILDELIGIAEKGAMASGETAPTGVSPALAVRCLGRQRDLSRHGWQLLRQLHEHWNDLSSDLQDAMLVSLSKNGAPEATSMLESLLVDAKETEDRDEDRARPGRYGRPRGPRDRQGGEEMETGRREIFLQLAARGNKTDYELLAKTAGSLDAETARAVAEKLLAADNPGLEAYYETLARIAGRPITAEPLAPEDFYRRALGLEEPSEESRGERDRDRSGRPRRRTPPRYGGGRPSGSESDAEEAPSERRAALPSSARVGDLKFRARCLRALQDGPDMVVGAVLSDPDLRLLDHPVLGPAAAWIAGQKALDFELPIYLRDRYLAGISERDRQAAVLCAVRDGGKMSEKLLEGILLGKLREGEGQEQEERPEREQPRREQPPDRYQRGGRGRPSEAGAWSPGGRSGTGGRRGERPSGGEQPRTAESRYGNTPRETMRYVGRGIGYLGNYGVLRRAIAYRRRGARLEYMHPLDHRLGALAGMAWLPPEEDPANRLRRFARSLPEPVLKKACAEAVVTYYRLKSAEFHQE